jgi:hypothetical protein
MAAFDVNGWMSVLPKVYQSEQETDPLKGPFNTPSKIRAAIHALSKLSVNDIKKLGEEGLMGTYWDLYKAGLKTYERHEDSELVVKVGSLLKLAIEHSKEIPEF